MTLCKRSAKGVPIIEYCNIAKITDHIQNLIGALEAVHVPRSQRASTKAASNFSTSNDIVATCSILSLIR